MELISEEDEAELIGKQQCDLEDYLNEISAVRVRVRVRVSVRVRVRVKGVSGSGSASGSRGVFSFA